jgi:hypothetical protein
MFLLRKRWLRKVLQLQNFCNNAKIVMLSVMALIMVYDNGIMIMLIIISFYVSLWRHYRMKNFKIEL